MGFGQIRFPAPIWTLGALALAQGGGEAGLYLGPHPTPTLELHHTLGETTLHLKAQWPRVGMGFGSGLALGPLGYLGYEAQGEVGQGGLGAFGRLQGGAGPLALEARLGYRPRATPPLFPEEGLFGGLALRYRRAPKETWGLGAFWAPLVLEATYARREEATYTLGLGVASPPYGILGWKGEVGEGGEVLDLALRFGGVNRLEAGLYLGEASLRLTLSYPWGGRLTLWLGDLGLEVGYGEAPYLWARYAWRWE